MVGKYDAMKQAEKQYGLISLDQMRVHLASWTEREREEAVRWIRRSCRFRRIFKGVYAYPGVPDSWEQRAMAALLVAGDGSALSHQTAAGLLKLDGFEAGGQIHVTVPLNRNMMASGIRVHHTRERVRSFNLGALRVTTLARTFVDLAAVVTPEKLEFALDSARRRNSKLINWIDSYVLDLKQAHRRKGLLTLMEFVNLRRDGAMDSVNEVRVWRLLRQHGFPPFVKRYVVRDKDGNYVMRLDFAWPELKVAIHADSYLWHGQRQRMARDADQRSMLNVLKWRCVTVMRSSLDDKRWVDQLRIILAERTELLAKANKLGVPLEYLL